MKKYVFLLTLLPMLVMAGDSLSSEEREKLIKKTKDRLSRYLYLENCVPTRIAGKLHSYPKYQWEKMWEASSWEVFFETGKCYLDHKNNRIHEMEEEKNDMRSGLMHDIHRLAGVGLGADDMQRQCLEGHKPSCEAFFYRESKK